MRGWSQEQRRCPTRRSGATSWRSSGGAVEKDPPQWTSEVRRKKSTPTMSPTNSTGGEQRTSTQSGKTTGTSQKTIPIAKRCGTPRWPKYSRSGGRARTLGEWERVSLRDLARAERMEGRRDTPKGREKERATHISLASVTTVGTGATRKTDAPRKNAHPMARGRGKVGAIPTHLRTMWRKSKTPRVKGWAIWKGFLNASAWSWGEWRRQKIPRSPPPLWEPRLPPTLP